MLFYLFVIRWGLHLQVYGEFQLDLAYVDKKWVISTLNLFKFESKDTFVLNLFILFFTRILSLNELSSREEK